MFPIIGIVTVIGMIVGGYLMAHGNLSILFQPAELVIIGGAAIGSFLIANPKKTAIGSLKGISRVFSGKTKPKEYYLEVLMLFNELLVLSRKDGLLSLEEHVNQPEKSKIFTKYPNIVKKHEVLNFICDNFKIYIATSPEPHVFENIMDIDLDALHRDEEAYPKAITNVADSLPGLGIVAAVLGVVVTMGKINEPPEVLGQHIGAALVGTFLGILACYGFVGPMATHMEHLNNDEAIVYRVVKAALIAFSYHWHPSLVIEAARRAIPAHERPSFNELEGALKSAKK
ncbi:MAG: flagellar motor stator protein MotA [Thermodesulfobacteriota bacterium]